MPGHRRNKVRGRITKAKRGAAGQGADRLAGRVAAPRRSLAGQRNPPDPRAQKEAREKTRTELRDSKARYRLLFDRSPDGIVILDPATARLLEFNETACRQLGYSRKEFSRLNLSDIDACESPGQILRHIAGVMRKGRHDFETLHRTRQGEIRNVQVIAQVTRILGRPVYHCVWRDITDRKRAEEALRRSETFIKSVMANLPIGIAVNSVDPAVKFEYMNENFPRFYRTTREALAEPDAFWEAVYEDPEFRAEIKKRVAADVAGGDPERMHWDDVPITRSGEKTTYITAGNIPLPDRGLVISTVSDVTARKEAETALRRALERLRRFIDANIIGVVVADAAGRVIEANDYYLRIIGFTREEFDEGRVDWRAVTPPEWLPADEAAIRELRERGTSTPYEKEYLRRDGTRVSVFLSNALLPGPDEQIAAFVLDITERKRADKRLRDSEETLRYIVKHDPNAIAVYDRGLHYIAVSDRYLQDYDVKEEDILGKHHYEVFPEMPERWKAVHRRCLAGAIERSDDDAFERPDGSITYNRWECRPWRRVDGEIGGIITYTEVTTERKKAEKALRESEKLYRSLFENMLNGLAYCRMHFDEEGRPEDFTYLSVNDAFQTLTGLKDVAGRKVSEVIPGIREADPELFEIYGRVAGTGRPERFETFVSALKMWFSVSVYSPERGYFVAVFDVINERKRAEEAVQASLREKETLLREIHHRVKNNMQVISSLFNLQAGHIKDEDARRMLKEGQLRIRSMALIHEKFYQSSDLSKVDFAAYLRSLANHLFQFFKVDTGRIRLETDLEDVLLDVNSAVPCGLLVNELISNSIKHAFPGGRKGTIGIGLRREKDGTVVFRVADDGVGFPEDLDFRRAATFGLQIVSLLVEQLEGTIHVDKRSGTAFTISFRELQYKDRI